MNQQRIAVANIRHEYRSIEVGYFFARPEHRGPGSTDGIHRGIQPGASTHAATVNTHNPLQHRLQCANQMPWESQPELRNRALTTNSGAM